MKFSYGVKHSLSSCSSSCGPGRKQRLEAPQEESCEDERKETRRSLGRAFGWHRLKTRPPPITSNLRPIPHKWFKVPSRITGTFWKTSRGSSAMHTIMQIQVKTINQCSHQKDVILRPGKWLVRLLVPGELVRLFQILIISWYFDAQPFPWFPKCEEKNQTNKKIQSVGGNG